MCFSAEASFVGAAVVGVVGVATLTQVDEPKEVVYGSLPLAFAFHQLLEGMTWVQLDGSNEAALSGWWVHLWVIYAWALLPLWVPFGIWLIEPVARRRRWLFAFVLVGAATLGVMMFGALQQAIEVRVVESNLDYELPFSNALLLAIPYVLTTCGSGLVSSFRWVRWFAVANILALSSAAVMQAADFSSIWCTFAAFLSFLVFLHFREQRKKEVAIPVPSSA
ncbi:MAG: hypothetical protein JJLCMIEE_02419 [Acidimicrobiales bacterium]|nr:MAG: hypothetical protein EDR02_12860 [Actinomycetota bacterium]MBV6509350.1 hypothetical protein [Acidimicrobiales bacterium]RIK04614.1 MAG: hypothetical protein DCC48_12960 [Acidobacteriota bacterium]